MADIELVIKIDEKLVEWINEYFDIIKGFNGEKIGIIVDAIKNGVLLPKRHGRLIDADALMEDYGNPDVEILLDNMDTIIEADKESED